MGNKYRKSAAPQKNPPVCHKKKTEERQNAAGDPADLVVELHVTAQPGSGVDVALDTAITVEYSSTDSSWIYGPAGDELVLKAEFELHPDDLHGRLTVTLWLGGTEIVNCQSPWIILESRQPLDTGLTRYGCPAQQTEVLFQVTG